MIIDKNAVLAEKLSLAAAAGNIDGSIAINIADVQLGEGQRLDIVNVINTDMVGAGASVTFTVLLSDNTTTGADGTWTPVQSSQAYPIAELVAGKEIRMGCSFKKAKHIKMRYTISGATTTGGTVTSAIVPAI